MHLRTIFLQNEGGKHLFPLLPNSSGRGGPAGICAPTFWGCTSVNPRLVSAGTPCCASGKRHTAALDGSAQLPRCELGGCSSGQS